MHIRQTEWPALKIIGELFMIEAQLVEDGRLYIVHGYLALDSIVSDLIGLSMGVPSPDAAASEPYAERIRMMVASLERVLLPFPVLLHGRPAEFTAPDHQGVLQQSPLFQVQQECGHRLVDHAAFVDETHVDGPVGRCAVRIPSPVEDLDETDPFLNQFAGEEDVVRQGCLSGACTVELVDIGRLVIDIHHFGNGYLHLVGHLILGDARQDLRIPVFLVAEPVHLIDGINGCLAYIPLHPGRVLDIQDGFTLRSALYALVHGRQEATAPHALSGIRIVAAGSQYDEARQVAVLRPETIGDPGSHAGPAQSGCTAMHQQLCRTVIELVRIHRLQDADLIGYTLKVGQQFGNP